MCCFLSLYKQIGLLYFVSILQINCILYSVGLINMYTNMYFVGKSIYSWSYFSFHPVLHDWFNNSCGMCYPVCGIVHIKEPLLLIGKSSPCCSSGFPLSLFEWSFTICLTPYNRKYNVLSVSLNKHFLPCVQISILSLL